MPTGWSYQQPADSPDGERYFQRRCQHENSRRLWETVPEGWTVWMRQFFEVRRKKTCGHTLHRHCCLCFIFVNKLRSSVNVSLFANIINGGQNFLSHRRVWAVGQQPVRHVQDDMIGGTSVSWCNFSLLLPNTRCWINMNSCGIPLVCVMLTSLYVSLHHQQRCMRVFAEIHTFLCV